MSPLLFVIFVNDLPVQVPKYYAFVYAEEFKFVATNSENMQYDRKRIENRCFDNKNEINEKKMLFDNNQRSRQNQEKTGQQHIEEAKRKKILQLQRRPNLNWKSSAQKSTNSRKCDAFLLFSFPENKSSTVKKTTIKPQNCKDEGVYMLTTLKTIASKK